MLNVKIVVIYQVLWVSQILTIQIAGTNNVILV